MIAKKVGKGILIVILAVILSVTITACSNKDNEEKDKPSSTTTTTGTAAPTTTEATSPAGASADDGNYPKTGFAVCDDSGVNVRRDTSTNYDPIGGLKRQETVSVLGKEGDWYVISWPHTPDKRAYVNAQYIVFSDPGTMPEAATTTTSEGAE